VNQETELEPYADTIAAVVNQETEHELYADTVADASDAVDPKTELEAVPYASATVAAAVDQETEHEQTDKRYEGKNRLCSDRAFVPLFLR
jgi:hypothetical protein